MFTARLFKLVMNKFNLKKLTIQKKKIIIELN